MTFSEQLENADKGIAYFIEEGSWYMVIGTMNDYRIITIHSNHSHKFEKCYSMEDLDEQIRYMGLEKEDWTFV